MDAVSFGKCKDTHICAICTQASDSSASLLLFPGNIAYFISVNPYLNMLVTKTLKLQNILRFAGGHLIWLTAWMLLVTGTYSYTHWKWMSIPWLPLSVVGTAVAFYVGFKNNQAYDRLWEGRKIWGSIINGSRSWGSMVRAYVGNQFRDEPLPEEKLHEIRKELLFRHIGWLYTLRSQLLQPTQWEHVSLRKHIGRLNRKRVRHYGAGLFEDEVSAVNIRKYLSIDEYSDAANTATQIIDTQSQELARLRAENLIDDFRHMELQRLLNDLYDQQGKAERIKKFPLPRQYGSASFVFVSIFIFLLPLGIVGEFSKLGEWGIWLCVPFGVLVGWIYLMMELVGDYSENPFEGLQNDVPMFSICRTIEIDLLQMLGEQTLPPSVKPKNGVLM